MTIKSRNRRSLKIAFVLFLAIIFFILWLSNKSSIYILLTSIFGFASLLEYAVYSQTTLELTKSNLKVQRKALLNVINEEYIIELENIQSSCYEKKKYDAWELYHRLLWELFFPSGQSYLVINKVDGNKHEIPFSGNENELMILKQKLPDRIPN